VTRQSEGALGRAERIKTPLGRWKLAIAGTPSNVSMSLVDLLAENRLDYP
jgi:hypothetical protein